MRGPGRDGGAIGPNCDPRAIAVTGQALKRAEAGGIAQPCLHREVLWTSRWDIARHQHRSPTAAGGHGALLHEQAARRDGLRCGYAGLRRRGAQQEGGGQNGATTPASVPHERMDRSMTPTFHLDEVPSTSTPIAVSGCVQANATPK